MKILSSEKLSSDQQALLAVIQQQFFQNSPIVVDIYVEGQRAKDGIITLGCKAGPSVNVWNLLHEMSHFVEIDDARMAQPGWGLKYGKYCTLFRSSWYEQRTSKSIRRELRVGAFQYRLSEQLGFLTDETDFINNYADTCRFLPTDALCTLALEENCRTPDGVVDYNAACKKVLRQLIADPKYSFPNFKAEWKRKNTLLQSRAA